MSGYRVGLTGGLASGKSTAGHFFSACGVDVVEADAIVAELTQTGSKTLAMLQQEVGDWIVTENGDYNREAVRRKIFNHPPLRRQIEAILHPLVRQQLRRRLQAARTSYAIGVIPLLFENEGWADYFHHIIVIDSTRDLQRQRAELRDNKRDADNIIAAQMPPEERRQRANEIINNDGDLLQLFNNVYRVHQKLLSAV